MTYHRRLFFRTLMAVFGMLLITVAGSSPMAATIAGAVLDCTGYDSPYTVGTVNTGDLVADFRTAVECANDNPADEIIDLDGQTITFTSTVSAYNELGHNAVQPIANAGTLTIRNGTIERDSALACDGGENDLTEFRFFITQGGVYFTILNMTLRNGCGSDVDLSTVADTRGGAIFGNSRTKIINSHFEGNTAVRGILYDFENIVNSSFEGNGNAGDWYTVFVRGTDYILNTTFTNNTGNAVVLLENTSTTIVNSTFVNNNVANFVLQRGGGVTAMNIYNVVLANNTAQNCQNSNMTASHSYSDDDSCPFDENNGADNATIVLGTLTQAANGTYYFPLIGGDPFNGGDNALLPTETDLGADVDGDGNISATAIDVDQIGNDRIADGTVDAGAHEEENTPPVAVDDAYSATVGQTLTVEAPGVLANDNDVNLQDLTALEYYGASQGAVNLNTDGSFTYTPNGDASGTDTFAYTPYDGVDLSANFAVVTITINPPNVPPVAVDDAYTVVGGQTLNIDAPGVRSNDSDDDSDPLTAVLDTDVTNGTLMLNSDGSFTYTPDFGFMGDDTFTYFANDGTVNSDTAATVTITVSDPAGMPPRLYPVNEQIVDADDYLGPNFQFRHIDGVDWYQVWIGSDTSTPPVTQYYFAWHPANNDAPFADGQGICDENDLCTIPYDIWVNNGNFSWWMTTWSEGDTSADINAGWNETTYGFTFPPPTNVLLLTNPADGSTIASAPTEFVWDHNPNVQWYQLWIGSDDYTNQIVFNWYDATEICEAGVCTLPVPGGATFGDGGYEVWAEQWGPGGYVTWPMAANSTFSIDSSGIAPVPRPTR